MTRSGVPLYSWNSPVPLTGNTELYLSRSVYAKQSGWLQNLLTDAGTCVHCTNTCPRYQPLWPATWISASLTHGQAYRTAALCVLINGYHKRHRRRSWSMEKAVACNHKGKMASLWTSAKLKPGLFRANTLHNRLFTEPPTVYWGKHVVSRSKSEGMRKAEYVYHFWKCPGAADRNQRWSIIVETAACQSWRMFLKYSIHASTMTISCISITGMRLGRIWLLLVLTAVSGPIVLQLSSRVWQPSDTSFPNLQKAFRFLIIQHSYSCSPASSSFKLWNDTTPRFSSLQYMYNVAYH